MEFSLARRKLQAMSQSNLEGDQDYEISCIHDLIGAPEAEPKHSLDGYQRQSKHFFRAGRLFKTLWEEPDGPSADDTGGWWFWDQKEARGRSRATKRMFVIVEARKSCSIGLMIRTYQRQGVGGGDRAIHQHGIIHSGSEAPHPMWNEVPRSQDERPMQKQAVRVVLRDSHAELDAASRINYGKPCKIEHDVKIKPVGMVHSHSIQVMLSQWRSVMLENSKDVQPMLPQMASESRRTEDGETMNLLPFSALSASQQSFSDPTVKKAVGSELAEGRLDDAFQGLITRDESHLVEQRQKLGERRFGEGCTASMRSMFSPQADCNESFLLSETSGLIQGVLSYFDKVIAIHADDTSPGVSSMGSDWQDELGRFRLFMRAWNESGGFLQSNAGDLNYDIFSDSILTDLAFLKDQLEGVLTHLLKERAKIWHVEVDMQASGPAEEALTRAGQIHESIESLNRTLRDLHEQCSIQDRDQVTSEMIERRLALIDVLTGHIETTHADLKLSDSRALARLAVSAGEEAAVCPVCEEPPEEFGLASETVTARDS